MSITMRTWAQHFLAATDDDTPERLMPIWNSFMTTLVDALGQPHVEEHMRTWGSATAHFSITNEQAQMLQEKGGVDRIAEGLGVRAGEESRLIGISVMLFGLPVAESEDTPDEVNDPRGPCARVSVYRSGRGVRELKVVPPQTFVAERKPQSVEIPAGTLGPNRELEPDVDLPDCDTRLCDTVQFVCFDATMHEDCPVADWFLGRAYIHKYTAHEADFRKALQDDPEFVAFLARQLKREEYGTEAMRKMRPVEGDCIYELHRLVSEKVPECPWGAQPEIEPPAPEPATLPAPCPSTPPTTAAPAPPQTSSPPPWPWTHREAANSDN